jgi:hypothetical protein
MNNLSQLKTEVEDKISYFQNNKTKTHNIFKTLKTTDIDYAELKVLKAKLQTIIQIQKMIEEKINEFGKYDPIVEYPRFEEDGYYARMKLSITGDWINIEELKHSILGDKNGK